jgi:hypothetical protein
MRCVHCGNEVEEGTGFCPYCGRHTQGEGIKVEPSTPSRTALQTTGEKRDAGAEDVDEVPRAAPMSGFGREGAEADKSRRAIFIAVGVATALLVAGLAWLATRRPAARGEEARLEAAVRPGSPEFPAPDRLIVEFEPDEDAQIGANSLGNWVVVMKPTVRNFTGRTVSGLEFRAAGLDLSGQTIRERTYVNDTDELAPNRTLSPPISINFPANNKPARLDLKLTGVRFK